MVYNAVTMSDFLTIYNTTHDSCYEEYQELRINLANVIWAGEDYDGILHIGYLDGDCVRIVRTADQTLAEAMGDA